MKFILKEDNTYMLQENTSKIVLDENIDVGMIVNYIGGVATGIVVTQI
jgi:hypothetical protein